MKKCLILAGLILVAASLSYADSPNLKYLGVKKTETGRSFAYLCNDNDKVIFVEQKNDAETNRENMRFVVNGYAGEWINSIDREQFSKNSKESCANSKFDNVALSEDLSEYIIVDSGVETE